MKNEKLITFRLVDKTNVNVKDKGNIEMTWGTATLDAKYNTRDKNGIVKQEIISVTEALHPRSGEKQKVPINGIQFTHGELNLLEFRDKHIIDGLRKSVNNINFENRHDSDVGIFYEVDRKAERLKDVDKTEIMAEAFSMLSAASVDSIIEYAKAIGGIDTYEVEQMHSKGKGKDTVKSTEEYRTLVKELKAFAIKDPQDFIERFNDKSRPVVASINDAMRLNVVSYNQAEREFSWILGNSRHAFATVPRGQNDHKKWLAGWLADPENDPTYQELLSKVKAAIKL